MPALTASADVRRSARLAVENDLAAMRAVDAEEGAGEFGAAGADEAGEPEDFAGMEFQLTPRCDG